MSLDIVSPDPQQFLLRSPDLVNRANLHLKAANKTLLSLPWALFLSTWALRSHLRRSYHTGSAFSMAPPADPPKTIALSIKVPPGHLADGVDEFSLGNQVAISQTVGQIRQQLSQSLPSTPAPERLRILFGGRALVDDEQTLGDALNVRRDPTQTKYYVHLIVKGEGAANAPVPRASSHRRGVSTPARSASPAQPQGQTDPPGQQLPGQPHIHAIHHHAHAQPNLHHMQAHQAAILAQQQQLHAQVQQAAFAQQQRMNPLQGILPFGGHGLAGLPPQMMHGVPQGFGQGMPQNIQVHGQHPTAPNAGDQVDGAADRDPNSGRADLAPGLPQQRSISQPPPQPFNRGMHIEGVGPNGERVVIHQQMVNLSPMQLGQHNQIPLHPILPGLSAFPGMPLQNQPRNNGPSALDQARANVAEMRRILGEIRDQADTDENRSRIEQLERRAQSLNDYIDPLQLGTATRDGPPQPAASHPSANVSRAPPQAQPLPSLPQTWQQQVQSMRQAQQQTSRASQSREVTAYLLSSPSGPQAILFTPQHGTFTGTMSRHASHLPLSAQPPPTPTIAEPYIAGAPAAQQGQANQPAVLGQAAPAQVAQAQVAAAPPDPLGPMAPIINHLWLLLRILIFAYFLLGANLGWRRPLALVVIGAGFWLMRQGLLAEGAVVRRWWDGVVNDGQPRAAQGRQQDEAAQQPGQQPDQPVAAGNVRPGQMPTPEQVAQRLLNEDRRQRNERLQWLREYLRPVERTIALLLASLFPGVGEAYVRAREEEQRRRAEEEVAARRREEEERQQKEEENKRKAEEEGGGSGVNQTPLTTEEGAPTAPGTAPVTQAVE